MMKAWKLRDIMKRILYLEQAFLKAVSEALPSRISFEHQIFALRAEIERREEKKKRREEKKRKKKKEVFA